MNIVEPILFQCKLNPLATAICVPGSTVGTVNYGRLEKAIHNVARNALESGIVPGNIAAILVADTILHAALILGLMHIGVNTVSLRGPRGAGGVAPDIILTDVPGLFSGPGTVLSADQSWMEGDGKPATGARTRTNEDDICRIVLTSGSTGVAKGIAFSHKLLSERLSNYAYSKGAGFAHCSRLFCDLGIGTGPGFRYAMVILSRGGTIFFLGPEPADILQTIDLYKIEGMATSPYGLAEFLKFFEADSAFQVGFDHIICQGAMLTAELSRRARARMCQRLYTTYGATETTTVAVGPASLIDVVPGAVGFVLPGVTVEALDKSGNVLPPGQNGALRIQSHHMASGYVGDPEATRTFFRDGYFHSGDIGHVTPEGLLVITGREKTALNLGGDTVSPESVEATITSFDAVAEAGVFALNNSLGIGELIALIVTRSPLDESSLREHCARRLPPSCTPVRFIVVDELPRGGQGKIERHRLPEIAGAKTPAP
jgi:acyl-coenzyme A synthetase/AMP-(fatty) acid ligase